MPTVDVRNLENQKVGEVVLEDEVFAVRPRTHVVYEEVKRYLASIRSGTAATKTRAMVAGSGKKPWRQKGTGRARHGSYRSPLWRHGGTTHGPQPRTYDLGTNRKAKKLAMRVVLSQKLGEKALTVLETIQLAAPKTRHVAGLAEAFGWKKKALIVEAAGNESLRRAARNHPAVKVVAPSALSVYDILQHDRLVLSRDAVLKVQEIFRP